MNNNGNTNPGAYNSDVKPQKKKNTWIVPVIVIALLAALVAGAVFSVPAIKEYIEERTEEDVSRSEAKKKANKTKKDSAAKKASKKKASKDKESYGEKETEKENETVEEHETPVFTMVTASSTRGTDTQGGQYSEWSVLSEDPMTKWVPTKSVPNGIGEWIQIAADENQYVSGIKILNGYHKDSET